MIEPDFLTATRTAYDGAAPEYAELIPGHYRSRPLAHALIPLFTELVLASGGGLVADAGCGPGHITAHLHTLGLTVFGVDLSPEMIAFARNAHPELRFEVGQLNALPVEDATLAAIVANYSIIHTPPAHLPATFTEFHRALRPGGHLLLGFQSGDAPAEPFDHQVTLAYRYSPAHVIDVLTNAGLTEVGRLLLAPGEDPTRGFPHAYIIARRD